MDAEWEDIIGDVSPSSLTEEERKRILDSRFSENEGISPDEEMQDKRDALGAAAVRGLTEWIRFLTTSAEDVTRFCSNGFCALHGAAEEGQSAAVKLLLALSSRDIIDIESDIKTGAMTPLHCAAANGHINCVATLIEYGADVTKQDGVIGWTPMHYAIRFDQIALARWMITNTGVGVGHGRDASGATPVDITGNEIAVRSLRQLENEAKTSGEMSAWNPYKHRRLFHVSFRDVVFLLLLCHNRQESTLHKIPKDILFLIIRHFCAICQRDAQIFQQQLKQLKRSRKQGSSLSSSIASLSSSSSSSLSLSTSTSHKKRKRTERDIGMSDSLSDLALSAAAAMSGDVPREVEVTLNYIKDKIVEVDECLSSVCRLKATVETLPGAAKAVKLPPRATLDEPEYNDIALKSLKKTLAVILRHKYSWPFDKPVDPQKLDISDYFDVVKKPMDLGTVKERLQQQEYSTLDEAVKDIRQVFTNCRLYNPPKSLVVLMANTLESIFDKKLAVLKSNTEVQVTATRAMQQSALAGVDSSIAVNKEYVMDVTAAADNARQLFHYLQTKKGQTPKQSLSVADRDMLMRDILSLPAPHLDVVFNIIWNQTLTAEERCMHFPPKELTVDLDKLEDVTLHAIQGYISSVKRVFEL